MLSVLAMVLANLALNLALWRRFSYVGLASTASVVALLQSLCLLWLIRRRIGPSYLGGGPGLSDLIPERFLPRKARGPAVEAEVANAQADAYDEA